ncbi:hypothetical protein [uncultured Dokdonia sp.]|uniref:hypothetical protein n=1 Tax=uncultured Dokdonia sp. TaxID=575653 RepID=UPI0026308D9E|nr:hypothetical protein [uncultured Dokdonia sp.]
MKNQFLKLKWIIAIAVILVSISCQTEDENIFNSTDVSNLGATEKVHFQITTKPNSNTTRRSGCTPSFEGSNNLTTCTFINYIAPITTTTIWTIGDNGPGYIDYELEQNFLSSCEFSYTCIRPCGPPIEDAFGEVFFIESPAFNFDTFEYDYYEYLSSDGITPEKANELKDHFACKIREYQQTNHPSWIVSDVNFFGDALLCNTSGISNRYLKATFKLTKHQCN